MTKKLLILLCETDAGFPTVVTEISNLGLLICLFIGTEVRLLSLRLVRHY
jgi:hypothetical protein